MSHFKMSVFLWRAKAFHYHERGKVGESESIMVTSYGERMSVEMFL
jgi:hypothetical protein